MLCKYFSHFCIKKDKKNCLNLRSGKTIPSMPEASFHQPSPDALGKIEIIIACTGNVPRLILEICLPLYLQPSSEIMFCCTNRWINVLTSLCVSLMSIIIDKTGLNLMPNILQISIIQKHPLVNLQR